MVRLVARNSPNKCSKGKDVHYFIRCKAFCSLSTVFIPDGSFQRRHRVHCREDWLYNTCTVLCKLSCSHSASVLGMTWMPLVVLYILVTIFQWLVPSLSPLEWVAPARLQASTPRHNHFDKLLSLGVPEGQSELEVCSQYPCCTVKKSCGTDIRFPATDVRFLARLNSKMWKAPHRSQWDDQLAFRYQFGMASGEYFL